MAQLWLPPVAAAAGPELAAAERTPCPSSASLPHVCSALSSSLPSQVRAFPIVGANPGPRCGHTLTTIAGPDGDLSSAKLVLFGGCWALQQPLLKRLASLVVS